MCEIPNAIKGHAVAVEILIRQQNGGTAQEQRVTIRRAARHSLTGNIPARAGAVINHHCLAEQWPHTFGN